MTSLRRITCAALVLSLTAAAVADEREDRLSDDHRQWLNEEVVYIMLEKERDVFLDLETEDQRDLFVEAFWAKRDPYPATLDNEFKTEHERRLFATASGDKSKSLKDELARLIKGRFRKRSKPEDSEGEEKQPNA